MKQTRIMYVEDKSGGITGPARVIRVEFSKSGKTLIYGNRRFRSLKGSGFKANYFDEASGAEVWISGPRKDGNDSLHESNIPVPIDENCREEYWLEIRNRPELKDKTET